MTMNKEFAKFLGWAYCSSIDNYSKEPLEEFVSKRENAEWEPCPDFTAPDGHETLAQGMRQQTINDRPAWDVFYVSMCQKRGIAPLEMNKNMLAKCFHHKPASEKSALLLEFISEEL